MLTLGGDNVVRRDVRGLVLRRALDVDRACVVDLPRRGDLVLACLVHDDERADLALPYAGQLHTNGGAPVLRLRADPGLDVTHRIDRGEDAARSRNRGD